jgi:oxygen-independent coproporphyrinogen-3 oxidase
MPSALPSGDPVPDDGVLPESALATLARQSFSIYLHVPFCTTRCGYCDFNTYTAAELGDHPGASRVGYIDSAIAELDLAARVLGPGVPEVSTVFVGGGTPTLLPPGELGRFVRAVEARFGLAVDAEITTESNPESVDAPGLFQLAADGFNRISFGMQSAVPHVLAVLDRVHSAGRPAQAVREAKGAGFPHTSLDLIYGTPGESLEDWHTSLEAAVAAEPDHLSAYSLIVEDGTRLATKIRRGDLPAPDDDDLAEKYLLADERLSRAGFGWYEVSNWARSIDARCQHNLAYWRSGNWWGVGPGAHSHVGGTRWWNVKHPAKYAARLAAGLSPAHSGERLSAREDHTERVLLQLRLAEGLGLSQLSVTEQARIPALGVRGLVSCVGDRVSLTLEGRLLADAVTRDLLDA